MIKSSFVVLPSYREGFPKVLMEAASLSKPAITTDVPGCNSAVEQNITGLVIPPRDTNALVNAMIYLLDNNKVRIKMGKEAFKKAKKDFDEVNNRKAACSLQRATTSLIRNTLHTEKI